jgi:hypothetical protein
MRFAFTGVAERARFILQERKSGAMELHVIKTVATAH